LNGDSPDDPLLRISAKDDNGNYRKFKVLSVNCSIPIQGDMRANTLIGDSNNLVVVAINDCNLFCDTDTAIRFISNDIDVTNEISEQSKQAILRANLK